MLNLLVCMKRQGISLGKNTVGQPLWLPHWIRQAPLVRSTKMGTGGQTSHHWVTGHRNQGKPESYLGGMSGLKHNTEEWEKCTQSGVTGGGGHPESCVWCINHSTEPTPKRLQPYGNNADRCPPVCALDSLSDTIRSTQIQHAMMIIVLSKNLQTGSGLQWES